MLDFSGLWILDSVVDLTNGEGERDSSAGRFLRVSLELKGHLNWRI